MKIGILSDSTTTIFDAKLLKRKKASPSNNSIATVTVSTARNYKYGDIVKFSYDRTMFKVVAKKGNTLTLKRYWLIQHYWDKIKTRIAGLFRSRRTHE